MSFWVAGAALVGTAVSAYSANEAENAQYDATQQANAVNQSQYNQTRQDNMPALDARNASLSRMRELLGIGGNTGAQGYGSAGGRINPGNVTNEAGYQFGLKQGQDALNSQLTARGMRNSGAALQAAARYGNDYATTKYDNAFNREVANRSAQLNPLQSLAGASQTGASTIAGAGQNYANALSGNLTAQGNAAGASQIAIGNALSGTVNQLGGWYANQAKQGQQSSRNVQGNSDYYWDV